MDLIEPMGNAKIISRLSTAIAVNQPHLCTNNKPAAATKFSGPTMKRTYVTMGNGKCDDWNSTARKSCQAPKAVITHATRPTSSERLREGIQSEVGPRAHS